MVEAGDLLAQVEIFEERGAALTGLQRVVRVVDAHALVGRQRRLVRMLSERLEAAILARPTIATRTSAVPLDLHGENTSLRACLALFIPLGAPGRYASKGECLSLIHI